MIVVHPVKSMSNDTRYNIFQIVTRHALVASIALMLMAVPAFAAKRIAFVVGNDDYENVTKLQKAVNDARGISDTLNGLGFDVTTIIDAPRREMNRSLQTFINSIEEGDIVLFFYAGHGVEIEGENYLLPVDVPDAKSDQLEFIKSETIRLNTILADLRDRKAQLNLVILDACRNNPFSRSAGRSLGGSQGLARISAPQGTFVMYSADVGETALDRLSDNDDSPNSIFTRTLIPLMKTPGLDLVSTARQARRQVRKLALSVSHQQTPAYYDAVLGDFYFTPAENQDNVASSDKPAPPVVAPDETRSQFDLALLDDPKAREEPLRPLVQDNDRGLAPPLVVTAGEKDLIRLWDAQNMSLLAELNGEKKLISSIKFINKGHSLLVAGRDGSVVSYALPSFRKTNAFYPGFEVSIITQTDDGTIMVGGTKGLLAAYDGETFEEIWRRQAHDGIISPILPVGSKVVSASGDGAIVTTDIRSGRELGRIHTFANGRITDIAFVGSSTIVASHEKGEIAYISLKTGKILNLFQAHDGWVSSVDVTSRGDEIVTAGVNGNLRFWTIGSAQLVKNLPAHTDVASGAKYMSVGADDRLISAGFDGVLRFWKSNGSKQITALEHGPAIIYFDYNSSP